MTEQFFTTLNRGEIKIIINECLNDIASNLNLNKLNTVNEEKTILTRKEAAKLLGISLPSLHNYTQEGKIQAFRLGNNIRYKLSDIHNALKPIRV